MSWVLWVFRLVLHFLCSLYLSRSLSVCMCVCAEVWNLQFAHSNSVYNWIFSRSIFILIKWHCQRNQNHAKYWEEIHAPDEISQITLSVVIHGIVEMKPNYVLPLECCTQMKKYTLWNGYICAWCFFDSFSFCCSSCSSAFLLVIYLRVDSN